MTKNDEMYLSKEDFKNYVQTKFPMLVVHGNRVIFKRDMLAKKLVNNYRLYIPDVEIAKIDVQDCKGLYISGIQLSRPGSSTRKIYCIIYNKTNFYNQIDDCFTNEVISVIKEYQKKLNGDTL